MISTRIGKSKSKGVVGLDIEASSLAATELHTNGGVRVGGYGIAPLDAGVFRDGEVHEPAELAEALKELFGANKLTRDVRLGVANQRVAVRTLRLPKIDDPSELEAGIRFQAQDHIPMPLDQAVLDWQVIPPVAGAESEDLEVVVVAARRDMILKTMEAVRGAGLRLVGIDHSAFALIRALSGEQSAGGAAGEFTDPGPAFDPMAGPAEPGTETVELEQEPEYPAEPAMAAEPGFGAPAAGRLYCNLGDVTNLAIARGPYCLFTRTINFGVEGIAQSLAERGSLTLEHARQWLAHVGLETPVEAAEGDPKVVAATREALAHGASKLGDELRRSLEYYATLGEAAQVESIVVAGAGTAIPGLVEHLRRELPVPLDAVTPGILTGVAGDAAARLTLSYGLGLES